jgi:hypothetical protein
MSLNKCRASLNVRPATLNRKCSACGNDIPKRTYCLEVYMGGKRRSFCVDCVYVKAHNLAEHHDVQALRERLVEQRL